MKKTDLTALPERLYRGAVRGLLTLSLGLLSYFWLIGTCYISNNGAEHTWFVGDGGLVQLTGLLLLTALAVLLGTRPRVRRLLDRLETEEELFQRLRRALLWALAAAGAVWVLASQIKAGADQLSVQNAAYALRLDNFSCFEPEGGYVSRYPNQLGLVFLSYLFSLVFGSYNYTALQLLNVAALVLAYGQMTSLAALLGWKKRVQLGILLTGLMFWPPILYTSFVYGTLCGLALSLLGMRLGLRFAAGRRTGTALLAALAMVTAYQFKNNYLIFLVALVIFGLVRSLSARSVKLLLLPGLCLLLLFGSLKALPALAERVTGCESVPGTSAWSFVAMGLQQNSTRAPGWYNGYNYRTYTQSGYDGTAQAVTARQDAEQAWAALAADPAKAVRFFTLKAASEWNEPTYQSFWNTQVRSSAITRSDWVWSLTTAAGTDRSARYLKLLQGGILLGAFLWCLLGPGGKAGEELLLPMTVVGGFLFHLVWEAKSQYTLPYLMLLIPYAVQAADRLTRAAVRLLISRQSGEKPAAAVDTAFLNRTLGRLLLLLAALLLVLLLYGKTGAAYLRADASAYRLYLLNQQPDGPAEGRYRITAPDGKALSADPADAEGTLCLSEGSAPVWRLSYFQNYYYLSMEETSHYLRVTDSSDPELRQAGVLPSTLDSSEKWQLKNLGDGLTVILCSNKEYALTREETSGRVYVTVYDTSRSDQLWLLSEE